MLVHEVGFFRFAGDLSPAQGPSAPTPGAADRGPETHCRGDSGTQGWGEVLCLRPHQRQTKGQTLDGANHTAAPG